MARDFAKLFYNSKQWKQCREGFMQSKNYICERCGDTASICHHKLYVTPANVDDPNITLNWDNLESVCHTCHNLEHFVKPITMNGLVFNSKGELVKK